MEKSKTVAEFYGKQDKQYPQFLEEHRGRLGWVWRGWDGDTECGLGSMYSDKCKPDDPDELGWYAVEECSGSDYAGSTCNRANYRAFERAFGDRPGVLKVHGGYDSFGIYLREDVADEEIIDCLYGLADYPLIDEEELSAYEMELTEEAWENWARADFIKAVEKKFGLDEHCEDWEADYDTVQRIFYEAAERANEYWEADGTSMHIRIDKVVAKVELSDLDEDTIRKLEELASPEQAAELERLALIAAVNHPDQLKLELKEPA